MNLKNKGNIYFLKNIHLLNDINLWTKNNLISEWLSLKWIIWTIPSPNLGIVPPNCNIYPIFIPENNQILGWNFQEDLVNARIYSFHWPNLHEITLDLFDNICNRPFSGKGACKVHIIYREAANTYII